MTIRKATTRKEPTLAEIDIENPSELSTFVEKLQKKAGTRIRAAVQKLKDDRIIDRQGNRVGKKLPADMKRNSKCQLPG